MPSMVGNRNREIPLNVQKSAEDKKAYFKKKIHIYGKIARNTEPVPNGMVWLFRTGGNSEPKLKGLISLGVPKDRAYEWGQYPQGILENCL